MTENFDNSGNGESVNMPTDIPTDVDGRLGNAFAQLQREVDMTVNSDEALTQVLERGPSGSSGNDKVVNIEAGRTRRPGGSGRQPWIFGVAAALLAVMAFGIGMFVFDSDSDNSEENQFTEQPEDGQQPQDTTPENTTPEPDDSSTVTERAIDSDNTTTSTPDTPITSAVTPESTPESVPGTTPGTTPDTTPDTTTPDTTPGTTPDTTPITTPDPVTDLDDTTHPWIYPALSPADLAQAAATDNQWSDWTESARLFVVDYLGFADPEFGAGEINAVTGANAFIDLQTRDDAGTVTSGISTIELAKVDLDGTDVWVVTEVQSSKNFIDAPNANSMIGSQFGISGVSSGFEANTRARVIPDFTTAAATTMQPFITGWQPIAYETSLSYNGTSKGLTVMVTGDAMDGEPTLALRRFVFNASAPPPLSSTEVVSMAAVTGVAANDTLTVRSGAGVSNAAVGAFNPDRRGVVLTGNSTTVGSSVWVEVELSVTAGDTGWVNSAFLTNSTQLPRGVAEVLNQPIGTPEWVSPDPLGNDRLTFGLTPSASTAVDVPKADLTDSTALATSQQWGFQDGTGDPVNMPLADRLAGFSSDPALTAPSQIGNGGPFIGSGNSINTLATDFPGDILVEFHNPGTTTNSGFDWSSVVFVVRPSGNQYYLVGVFDHGWTI